ncbi:hypothetical protein [Lacticaseibacillus daqingensis]|uniref:hypothetical protein n=1 Tax=Lacticaseibacillus daqingensis TaxID=2486014 RepID=UPI000F76E13F|nr:hypothetical protein [Lacticaseibacillus daqingensis]
MSTRREYLLMTTKHTGDNRHPEFWGTRTGDGQPRSWSGYMTDPMFAELYTIAEIKMHFDPAGLYPLMPFDTPFGQVELYTPEGWDEHTDPDQIFVISVHDLKGVL